MADDDFAAFKADNDGGEPPDGTHTAWLDRAAMPDTRNGRKIVLEWVSTDRAYAWSSWHALAGKGKPFTKRILAGLGISLDSVDSFDELEGMLGGLAGRQFAVTVERNGDWLNVTAVTTVEQTQLDLPVEVGGTPQTSYAADLFDDDVPF